MKPERVVENLLEGEPDLDQKLGVLQGQAKEAGDLLDRTGKALERTHPKAQHPALHQRLGDIQQKRREADDLLSKARYAAAYRTALHKVGLKPTDVVARFGGEAWQVKLSNQRRGKFINAVETKDGRRVKLDPPVEIPPQTLKPVTEDWARRDRWKIATRKPRPYWKCTKCGWMEQAQELNPPPSCKHPCPQCMLRRKSRNEFPEPSLVYYGKSKVVESADPDNPDSLIETLLEESPAIKTLKDNQKPLSDDERAQVMKAKAVWHHGAGGAPSPAVKKSVVRGRTYFWSSTHRCYQTAPTLKGAIRKFHKTVEPSA